MDIKSSNLSVSDKRVSQEDKTSPPTAFEYDLICFSHLRWDFVYQRPQHLISRFARSYRVFFVEEPVFDDGEECMEISPREENLWVVLPHMKHGLSEDQILEKQKDFLIKFFDEYKIIKYKFWYYTPMAIPFTDQFKPDLTIFDCMDELSAFKFAHQSIKDLECRLLEKSDVVFTGGHTLYQAKKHRHSNIHPFPSSIDKTHFGKAREIKVDPPDQKNIPHPRLGFYGVIDERFDTGLIKAMGEMRPDWHFIMLGPVIKIDRETLPESNNVHFLGSKTYDELPHYVAGWDIALIPFMINESTQFISPTKTPEYLAAGKPVISTPISDVIDPYGKSGLVHIASTAEEFIKAAETELYKSKDDTWISRVDDFLSENSWDHTWSKMRDLINETLSNKTSDT